MKTPNKFPKSLIIALLFTLVVIVSVRFCLPTEQNISYKQSKTIKVVKTKPSLRNNTKAQRSLASASSNQADELVTIKSKSIKLVEKKYFSILPNHIKWSVTPVASTSKGQQVRINLNDSISGKKTSYHALVEPHSGKILTTWHRQIQH